MARPVSMKIGERFGRLVVLERAPNLAPRQTRWLCRCDCGNEKIIYASNLRRGETVSCGCYMREAASKRATTHQMTDNPAYRSWIQMRTRCNNPKATSYAIYGGRGIKVCQRWDKFENFLADMGPRPSMAHSLDRIDTNADYSPENCRWSTRYQQQQNKRNSMMVTYRGHRRSLAELAHEAGLHPKNVFMRVYQGWDVERALAEPIHGPFGRKLP